MEAEEVYGMCKSYTDDSLNGLGAVAGKPCTIKSTKEVETGIQIVFEWTGNDGTVQNTTIVVPKGSGGTGGTTDYADLTNKPSIAGVELRGNKTLASLGAVSKADIKNDLVSTDIDKPVSANMANKLSQMFLDTVDFNINTKEVIITALNGNVKTFSLEAFITAIVNGIGYGKAFPCDSKPTIAKVDGAWIVTYVLNGETKTHEAGNTWFYYKNAEGLWVQTLFVEGVDVTMQAGTIGDAISIDATTKHWLINGVDTGVLSQGYSPEIAENQSNDNAVYKLDIKNYDYSMGAYNTTTTPNLRGKDSVQVPLNGMYKIYTENDSLVLECEDGATPPPLSLENNKLYYTVGGTIQYVSKESV